MKWVPGAKNAILFMKNFLNMFITSLKGKYWHVSSQADSSPACFIKRWYYMSMVHVLVIFNKLKLVNHKRQSMDHRKPNELNEAFQARLCVVDICSICQVRVKLTMLWMFNFHVSLQYIVILINAITCVTFKTATAILVDTLMCF